MTKEELQSKIIEVVVVRGLLGDYTELTEDIINTKVDEIMGGNYLYALIFTPKFAKAFWGERGFSSSDCKYCPFDCVAECCPFISLGLEVWQMYQMILVHEKEPLKFLEKFLKENK